jgi:hypothetical protein
MALSPRTQHYLFITIMVAIMSCVISLTLTIVKIGFGQGVGHLVEQWLRNWALAAIIAWPTAALAVPTARKIVTKLAK